VILFDLEHISSPDLTVTIDYDTAKALLVSMDVNAAMGAFMRGEIKVTGDIGKLMALQATQIEPLALEGAGRIQAMTE
ncbi:MAG: SCP2 sterol-binding domain-containing protein, partial [Actinomycetota bacterium]